jgi:hypothetical protein
VFKFKIIAITLVLLLTSLFAYDYTFGKTSSPKYYTASTFFCSQNWAAITLPPVGIFLCSKYTHNQKIISHELVHWGQYHKMGTIGFYTNYITGWVKAGFKYENIPMEKEAYRSAGNAL